MPELIWVLLASLTGIEFCGRRLGALAKNHAQKPLSVRKQLNRLTYFYKMPRMGQLEIFEYSVDSIINMM